MQTPSRSSCDSQHKEGAGSEDSASAAEKNSQLAPQDDIPDGGIRAWLVVFGAWCGLFCSLGWLNSIGTFQSYYQTTMLKGLSASTISWIPSLEIFFTFVMSPIIGWLYDRFGPRWVLLGGTFLHVFGLMMASLATDFYQVLLAQGVCSALGVCAIFQPCMASIPSWFMERRGFAYGVIASGTSLGGVIFPIMISRLIAMVGFGWSMRIAGFIILALLTVVNLTVRPRTAPQRRVTTKADLQRPFTEAATCLLFAGFFFLTFGVFIPINYLQVQAIQGGMSTSLAQYLPSLLNAASLFGRITAGALCDLIGSFNVVALACYTAGILSLALWIPAASSSGILAFTILFGFFSGAYVALASAMVVRISPLKEIGYRTGLLFFVASWSGLTASPIGGAILASQGGAYSGMQTFGGVTLIVGSSFVLAARLYKTGVRNLFTKF